MRRTKLINDFRLLVLAAFQSLAVCAHAAAPTIVAIPDQTVYVDHPALVELLVSDAETPTNLLSLKLSTSNPTLIDTNKNVVFHWFTDGGSAFPRWYMTVAPTFGLTGTATNTVTVSDGTNTASATFLLTVVPPPVYAARFANTNQITLPTSGIASQYPSTMAVSGMVGTMTNVVVTISGFWHQNPNDLHMLLVSPTGRGMVFWSKVGGGGPSGGVPPDHFVTNVTATVTDSAPDWSPLPPFYFIWTERFRAGDYATGTPQVSAEPPANNFPAPAPAGPYAPVPSTNSTALHEAFAGLDANGTWSLYIYDDAAPYAGKIMNGWSLTVSTTGPPPPTITDIANQTILTNTATAALPFTIADADTPVGSLTLSNASSNTLLVPTNNIVFGGSGSNRTVTVTPAPGQSGSSTISLFVNDGTSMASDTFLLTVLTALPVVQSFTNPAAITIRDTNSALPYPSTIAVSGFSGVVSNVTVTLSGFNQTWGSDVDVLLVGPAGQNVMLLSDAASGYINNITFTLSDAAATGVPASGLPAGTYQPVNLTDASPLGDSFPAPAPAGPYGTALSVFQNTTPNGTWSLYVFDDGPGDIGSFSGGWSMTITTIAGTPSNTAPTISAITNQITTVNTPKSGVAFTVGDAQTAASNLVLSVASANITLVPTSNITFGGSGANRTVTITPASNQRGAATITLIVSDGTLSASNSFVLAVNPALLTVTGNSTNRSYGATNPVLTGSFSGLQAGDVITASFVSAAATNSSVGAYPITFTLSDPGNQLGNYTVATNNGTLTVTNAPLTVTGNSASRTYGMTNPVLTGSVTGVRAGDVITAGFVAAAATNSPVGSYPLAVTLTDPGSRLGNYSVTTNNGTLSVTNAPLTVTEHSASRSYGATNPVLSGSIAGLLAGDNITASFISAAATNSPVGAYPITFSFADPGSRLGNYFVITNNASLTVTGVVLTVTENSASRSYGAANPALSGSVTGLRAGDVITASFTTAATTNSPVGSYAIATTLSDPGVRLGNYSVTTNDGTLTVAQAALTVAGNNASRRYGATNPVLTGLIAGLQAGDAITASFNSAANTNSPVGAYPTAVTLADPGSRLGNYTVVTNNGTLTVTPAALLVKANNTNKVYRTVLTFAGGEFSIIGGALFEGDTLTTVSLTSPGANKGAKVGTYPITASAAQGLGLTNYSITYSNGILTVGPATLTVAATSQGKPYGTSLTLLGTAFTTGELEDGDSVTNVALASEGASNPAPAGVYAITPANATGIGLTNYSIDYSNGTMTVGAANLVITATGTNKVYGTTLNPAKFALTGLLNSDSVTNVTLTSPGSASNATVGSYAIVASAALGSGLTNYAIGYSNGTMTVAKASLTVTADDQSRAYGQPNPAFTISLTGLVNGEGPDALDSLPLASTTATNTTAPGSYPITLAGGADDNYSFSLFSGSLSITPPGDITITTVEMLDADHFRLAGTGDANVSYQIQTSSDLQTWQTLGTTTANGAGAFEFVDASAGGFTERYYRLATP